MLIFLSLCIAPLSFALDLYTTGYQYCRNGTESSIGAINILINQNDFRDATEQKPYYIGIKLRDGVTLSKTIVDWQSTPIYLASHLYGNAGYEDVTLNISNEAVALVRCIAGEDKIWVRINESSSEWINFENELYPPGMVGAIHIQLGILASKSSHDSAPLFELNRSSRTANSRTDNLPAETIFTVLTDVRSSYYFNGRDVYNVGFSTYLAEGVETAQAENEITIIDSYLDPSDRDWPVLWLYDECSKLLFPWFSNSDHFKSQISLTNFSPHNASFVIRERGMPFLSSSDLAPSGTVILTTDNISNEPLILGRGRTLLFFSSQPQIKGSITTYLKHGDTIGAPSRSHGIDLAHPDSAKGHSVSLGALPLNGPYASSFVLVNAGSRATTIELMGYNETGEMIYSNPQFLEELDPLVPKSYLLSDLEIEGQTGGFVTLIATSDIEPITGVIFTFDAHGNPSQITTRSLDYTPPSSPPVD